METRGFVKTYSINAPIKVVYKALTDQDIIEQWSGTMAVMDPVPGGKFSMWDDTINGKNTKVEQNQIVQQWKEETWDKYSIVTINLTDYGQQTEIELIHELIPFESYSNVKEGWDEHFMGPMKEYIEEEMV